MLRRRLNLGILAHVDAGKTTLTERLLHAAGVIDDVGRVDHGTTQTDTLALERRRGITIRSAVVAFSIGGVEVNLIDTPGHPDFIAEVERVLGVLDGAVLVLSAVEGVQPQTVLLYRALARLGVPMLLFVNKTDRRGARHEGVLDEIRTRLTADRLPVFFGSALTGTGIAELTRGIVEHLPARAGDPGAALGGTVFKVERGTRGEKIAYVRLFSGTLRLRDRVLLPDGRSEKVTGLAVFADGTTVRRRSASAGEIAKVWGLAGIRIGDPIGTPPPRAEHHFAPPLLETAVVAARHDDGPRLRVALAELADQDPLISIRLERGREPSVLLYGEVQKEVLQATLLEDYGVEAVLREATPVCVERPRGSGEAIEVLHADGNPYLATIGLRVEPAPVGSGVEFRLAVEARAAPLHVYKRLESFADSMARYVRDGLEAGLHGWRVTDCLVTMTDCVYSSPDGPASVRGPLSTAADFRKLTPIVLAQALARARTVVCEPVVRVRLEVPGETVGAVLSVLALLEAAIGRPAVGDGTSTLTAVVPAARLNRLQRQLPDLTGGEGVLESSFAGYRAVTGEPPSR